MANEININEIQIGTKLTVTVERATYNHRKQQSVTKIVTITSLDGSRSTDGKCIKVEGQVRGSKIEDWLVSIYSNGSIYLYGEDKANRIQTWKGSIDVAINLKEEKVEEKQYDRNEAIRYERGTKLHTTVNRINWETAHLCLAEEMTLTVVEPDGNGVGLFQYVTINDGTDKWALTVKKEMSLSGHLTRYEHGRNNSYHVIINEVEEPMTRGAKVREEKRAAFKAGYCQTSITLKQLDDLVEENMTIASATQLIAALETVDGYMGLDARQAHTLHMLECWLKWQAEKEELEVKQNTYPCLDDQQRLTYPLNPHPRSAYRKRAMVVHSEYEDSIVKAAKQLIEQGKGNWLYQTQYASGTTVWGDPQEQHGETISIEYSKSEVA